ncbi:MAG: DUF177 domain-containing protein [Bacteroidales bacterium]
MRNCQKPFTLAFSGLSVGIHHFSYDLENAFFENIEYSEIQSGQVHIELTLEKSERMMLLGFTMNGHIDLQCDRCLKDLPYLLDLKETVVVKFTSHEETEMDEDNLWYVSDKTTQIDLSSYFYETLVVQRPLQIFCPLDKNGKSTCDPQMLKRLQVEDTLADLKLEENLEDLRWSALKNFNKEV